eukprot:9109935-Heterocapsa_arctica.AAC.1
MTEVEVIGSLADYVENNTKLRKPLSRLGAIRISRSKAKIIADATEAPNNYCIILMNIKIKGENKFACVFYQDGDSPWSRRNSAQGNTQRSLAHNQSAHWKTWSHQMG